MSKIKISAIAAIANNNIIGADNDMPWRLSTDLKRFKALTLEKPVIMGRRTFESIGKALPKRLNIVVSRQKDLQLGEAVIAPSLKEALVIATKDALEKGLDEIMITGGGQIYKEAMPLCDKLYITHVDAAPSGDTFFPEIDKDIWKMVHEESVPKGEKDSAVTIYRIYERLKS